MIGRSAFLAIATLLLTGSAALPAPHAASLQQHERTLSLPLLQSPEQDDANGLLAFCLMQFALGDLTAAEEACGQALVLDPKRADAWKLRGYAYLMEGRDEEAVADFRAGLKFKPSDDQLVAGYGQGLSNLGQYIAAAEQFHKALSLAPDKASYLNGLCWAQAGTGQKLDQALTACNRAIVLEPGAAAPRNSRGLVYLRMRRFSEAVADYTKSLELSPDLPSARFGLGLVRLSMGDGAGAFDIQEARRSYPGIDQIFIDMGLLPDRCDTAASNRCPPGFPSAPAPRPGDGVIAKAPEPVREEILRMAGLFPH
jgi:Flp pilus assembly protein TadD